MDGRELALDLFLEMEKNGAYANALIRSVMDKYDYEDPKEKAFFKRLTEGTLERRITLDWALDCCSKTPVKKMKPLIRSLLRLSAYQILYMEAVPDPAACNEAVKLAKKRGFSSLGGFVNGVLRSLSRNKENLPWPDPQKDPQKAMSVTYSLPEWLIGMWNGQYGKDVTKELLEGMQTQRPVIIRLSGHMSPQMRQKAVEMIQAAGVTIRQHPLYQNAFELGGCEGVASLPGFAEGLFYVQDVSSMLAVEAAGIAPGMQVVDLCAAPGGKALLAAEKLEGKGLVLAGDVSEEKARFIKENAARMGCENIRVFVWDARSNMERLNGQADVVLADLPCSGLGVMGRKKDIRYRVEPGDLRELVSLQKEILSASWQYVKPGGVLLYSTCTVNRAENEEMVRFLTEHYPLEAGSLDEYLPECLHNKQTAEGCCQLFPGKWNTDGFFMARLRRTK